MTQLDALYLLVDAFIIVASAVGLGVYLGRRFAWACWHRWSARVSSFEKHRVILCTKCGTAKAVIEHSGVGIKARLATIDLRMKGRRVSERLERMR